MTTKKTVVNNVHAFQVEKKSAKKTTTKKKKQPPPKDPNKLSEKEEKFCLEYIANHGNATRAAEAAGYKGNDNSLAVQGNLFLRKLKIKNRLKELTYEYIEDKKRLGRAVINELITLGFRKMSDFVEVDKATGETKVKPFDEMEGKDACIDSITVNTRKLDGGVVETDVKIHLEGKTKPLDTLAKYTDMVREKSEVDHIFPGGEFASTKEIKLNEVLKNLSMNELKVLKKAHLKLDDNSKNE